MNRFQEERRAAHRARGEDPDDETVVLIDTVEILEDAWQAVRDAADREGVDTTQPSLLNPPVVLAAAKLERTGMALADALHAADDASTLPCDEELTWFGVVLAMKASRVGSYLADTADGSNWEFDAVPNLLLMERLCIQLRARLESGRTAPNSLATRDALAALDGLDAVLAPLTSAIGEASRQLLLRLIRRAQAPSPFCTREHVKPDAS